MSEQGALQNLVVDLPINLVHFSGCPKLASIKPGRIKSVHLTQRHNYVYCPKCQTISYIFNQDREANIAAIKEAKLQYILKGSALFIQTESSFWKIKYDFPVEHQQLVLFHGNFKPTSDKIQPYKCDCYHRQYDAKGYRTIPQMLKYIVDHDKFRNDPSSASVKKVPKGNKRQKVHRERMKKSIQRARIKRTLGLLDDLKPSDTDAN